jgi:hypothetical protein
MAVRSLPRLKLDLIFLRVPERIMDRPRNSTDVILLATICANGCNIVPGADYKDAQAVLWHAIISSVENVPRHSVSALR